MTDIWVCSTCHSINRQRNDRCYKCGADQAQATGALADTRTERAIATRAFVPYRGSLLRFLIAGAFIIAVAVLGVIELNESLDAVRYLRDQIPVMLGTGVIDEAELARRSAGALIPALARTVCAIGALLFFAAWLSRVIANIPALGGGTPRATPTRAFIYPLIPVWNLFKTPPMIQEAMYRLDPKAGGLFMILLAWVGLVGSWIVSFVVGWWVNLRILSIAANAETLAEAIDQVQAAYDVQVIVEIITTLMVSAGALVLVVIMVRIESRARARNREIVAAVAGGRSSIAASPAVDAAPKEMPSPAPAVVAPPAAVATPAVVATPADAPAPGTAVDATSLGASPFGSGPRLDIVVGADGITASVDGSPPEPTTVDELRAAATALAAAGGTAIVTTRADGDAAASTAGAIMSALRAASVPVRQD
jgi:Domain of unknown function (DUF4328)